MTAEDQTDIIKAVKEPDQTNTDNYELTYLSRMRSQGQNFESQNTKGL